MNKRLKLILGSVGFIVSLLILGTVLGLIFLIFIFAGMSGDPSGTNQALMVVLLPVIPSIFLVWQFTRLIQSKTHINGFILAVFLILLIIFIKIPFNALDWYDETSDAIIPHSILDMVHGVFE